MTCAFASIPNSKSKGHVNCSMPHAFVMSDIRIIDIITLHHESWHGWSSCYLFLLWKSCFLKDLLAAQGYDLHYLNLTQFADKFTYSDLNQLAGRDR